MSAVEAARLGDQVGHSSAMGGLLAGALAGVLLAVAVIAIVGTGGVAAVAIGAGIAAAGAGGALAGKSIGEMLQSSSSGEIKEGSEDTDIGRMPAARAGQDHAKCRHGTKLIAVGSSTVLINNLMAARRTDKIKCGAKIAKGFPTVIIGGEPARVEGVDIDDEVPKWLVTSLKVVAIAGTVIATGGLAAAAGWGVALGGLGGGILGGEALGYAGSKLGGALGGELGARIGATIGSTVGGLLGGMGGGRLGGWLSGARGPLGRPQRVGAEPDEIPVFHRDGTTSKFQVRDRSPRIHKTYDVEVGAPLRAPGPPPKVSGAIPATSKTPYYSQEQTMSCGMATSRMVIASKTGMNVPEATLRAQSTAMGGYDPMRGTKMPKVAELLQENGVPASYERTNIDGLAARASSSNPVIAEMKGHVVVVDGVHDTPAGRLVSMRDPNPRMGPGQMREADFLDKFEGAAIFTDGR